MSGILNALFASVAKRFLKVGSVTVNSNGQYSGTPNVVFTGGGGSGAAAIANMAQQIVPGSVSGITGSAGWYNVSSAVPTVVISGGGGSGATATAILSSGKVYDVIGDARTTQRSGNLIFSGGDGAGAAGTYFGQDARFGYTVLSFNILNGGSGYTSAPTVVFTPKVGTTSITLPTATATVSDGQVTGITLNSDGEMIGDPNNTSLLPRIFDYPIVSLSGGGGSGAIISTVFVTTTVFDYWVNGAGAYPSLSNNGSGYTTPPSVTVNGLVAGTLTALVAKSVDNVTIDDGGTGYSLPPTVSLTGGTLLGTQFSYLTASTNGSSYNFVNSITVTNSGTGYTSAPSISFSGGGASVSASATANMVSE